MPFLVLTVFGALLILIFYVEVPSSMETLCATMLGGLISTVHAVISHFLTQLTMLNVTKIRDTLLRKSKVELERDRKYEQRWVWYHTLLAVELLIADLLLIWIAIQL